MSGQIPAEAAVFLHALLLGAKFMCLYDGLRLCRWLLPHGRRLRDAEDILYWVYCGLWAFAQAFYENDGKIRWYFTAGIAIGMILWNYICSGILKKTLRWVTMRKKGRTEPKRRQSVRDSTKRNRKKKENRNRSVLPIFFVVAALLTVLTVYTRSLQKADAVYAARVDALQNEVDTEKQRQEELEEKSVYVQTKDYIEQIAREKLGLINPDETIIRPEN